MQQSRRAYLRGAGALALGVGVAGCSSGNDGDGESPGSGGGDSGSDSGSGSGSESGADATSASETSGSEAAASGDGGSSATPGQDASATGLSGTVADKSAQSLSFVKQNHYSMNGVQGVTGRIKNTSSSAVQEVTIHATVQPGNAGPYTEALDGGALQPGETRQFKFGFGDDAPDEVESYTIWATTGQQG